MKKFLILLLLLISTPVYAGVLDFAEDTTPTSDDIIYVINDPVGVPGDRKVTKANWQKIPFNSGVVGSIPGTCTEPQVYWATDTDVLYICTATNTWTIHAGNIATDSIWDAVGDQVVGTGANTAAVVSAGTENYIWTMGATTPAWSGTVNISTLNIPSSDADPSTIAGRTMHDTVVTGSAQGAMKYWDGVKVRQIHDDQVSAIPLLTTGIVDGKAPIVITTTSAGYSLGVTYKSGYTFTNPVTAAATFNFTLPTAAAGLQYCVGNGATKTGILKVNASAAGQYIDLDGTLSATGGFVSATAVAGNFGCFVGIDATNWKAIPTKGTWSRD